MKKIKQIISIGTVLAVSLVHAQLSPTENYVYSKTYLDYNTSNVATKTSETVQYFDGLGRPKQVVNIKASPTGKDVVTSIEYDGFGRQVKDYLPVPQSGTLNGAIVPNPLTNATQPAIYGQEKIYAEKTLENSPLDRVLEQRQVGTAWNDKPVKFEYGTNTGTEVKKYVTVTSLTGDITTSAMSPTTANFGANQLYKNTVTDEDGNKTIEFKNGKGQLILVRKVVSSTVNADTYYVYNEYNQLAFVIPPMASVANDVNTVLNDLCYIYRYDSRNRLVEKKLPGKGSEYMVYDKADKLIMTQDAELRKKGKWLLTKYDQFGRVIYTGITPGTDRASLQSLLNNYVITESRNAQGFIRNGMQIYYTNDWVNEIETVLSVNYYDTYPAYSFNPAFPSTVFAQTVLTDNSSANSVSTKGLPVMSLVKNIEDDNWTKNYTYYDTKGRAISSHSINHLGGFTRTSSDLDFSGTVKQTLVRHTRLATDTERSIRDVFTYDTQNRLLTHTHQVGTGTIEYLAQNKYNELSQLESKKVGGSVATPLQQVDYKYNIRGWMTQINDPATLGSDLFGYAIRYNSPIDPGGQASFNGNITETDWNTKSDNTLRRYDYYYDTLNRFNYAQYNKPNSTVVTTGSYNEGLTYDLNGNIKAMSRTGQQDTNTPIVIDNLQYTYSGNKLLSIKDLSQNLSGYPYLATPNTISYDDNGNMTDLLDKGINKIIYNYLNLPTTTTIVNGGSQQTSNFVYRADGTKIRKSFKSTLTKYTTDYLDGFQYQDAILQFVPTSEGYYDFVKNKYIYNYTDHLGNVRLSYLKGTSGLEVIEENNYYPFGLKHEGYNALPGNGSYQYKYNGKELQETGMYDYGARFYMPDLGRWGVVDELSEKFSSHSNYAYVINDPINGFDPDGRDVIFLADSKAVPVAGHGAVIVGNEKDGWYYYSMNGTGEGSRPYGDSKNADVGTFLGTGLSPKQAMLKANIINPNPSEKHHYDKFVTVKTTKEEDAKIKAKAAEAANAEKYKVIGQSCANVMLNAFNQIVDLRTNNAWYVPHQINPAPNAIVDNFQKGVNYYNRFFIPSDSKIETRKVGKLEVGPLIDAKGIEHY